jgi:hypothetical protein
MAEPTPIIEPIDDLPPLQESMPKRRRGRPPRDPNAPKRAYRRRTAPLETRIGGMLTRVNLIFQVAATIAPGTIHPDDPLAPSEISALAKALTVQAQKHATFRKYLEYVLATTDNADLIFVLSAIGVRRLANHGIVPAPIGLLASATLDNPDALASLVMLTSDDSTNGTE